MADIFASIAGRGASLDRSTELEPVAPFVPLPDGVPVWESVPTGQVPPWEPLPRIADEAALAAEMERLHEWARPFLQSHAGEVPPGPDTRESVTLVDFDWKLVAPGEESGFAAALAGGGEGWEKVRLPHYGPPTGRALAWYRGTIDLSASFFAEGRSRWLCFGGADYRARVTVNGRCVGEHEGFFAPFEFDLSRTVTPGRNTVMVELWNDGICMGHQGEPDGDKLYAATGLGWDEAGSGWHHCPPGMGLWRPVRVESRPAVFLRDVWVRPLPGLASAEVRAEVHNTLDRPVPIIMQAEIAGENFLLEERVTLEMSDLPWAGLGTTFYRKVVTLPEARRWSVESPWLYRAAVRLNVTDEGLGHPMEDRASVTFGMREFRIDEATEPKGRIFLNDQPIRLRGANTMGFEQQRVMAGDLEGLVADLLLAKACHMNFLRFTQRPVEREVYELCDRLGLMAQSDLPLFAYLRRTQFSEAVRQSAEMARHTRRHASNVLLSFINEPFPLSWGDKTHRQLDRTELEGFLAAAAFAIRVEDPDITIKPVDGDYDPPASFGLPDSHIYTLWYNGHGLAYGQLHQGAFPATKKGWCFGCGEYGAEGLDFPDLMRRRYPAEWLPRPNEAESDWTPARIFRAQTSQMQPLFFDRQQTLSDWCAVSQEHQRRATKDLTEAFRRMDRLVSCAIHLFIDAWPAGWMKTIVDCERRPKPAFFALREAFAPVLLSPRSDRRFYTAGESAECELWVCNDTAQPLKECSVRWQITGPSGETLASGSGSVEVPACTPVCGGIVRWSMPEVAERGRVGLRAALLTSGGRVLAEGDLAFEVFPRMVERPSTKAVLLENQSDTSAAASAREAAGELASELAGPFKLGTRKATRPDPEDTLALASCWPENAEDAAAWLRWVEGGGTLVLYDLEPCTLDFPSLPGVPGLPGGVVEIKRSGFWSALFVSRATGHPMVADFAADDFRYWFDDRLGRIEPFLPTAVLAPDCWQGILATGFCGWGEPSQPAHAVCELPYGAGRIRLCQLQLVGKTKANPPALAFAEKLLAPSK